MDNSRFYLFTRNDDLKESLVYGVFYLARSVPDSISLEFANHDGDQILFCIVFDKDYCTTRLTKEQYDQACQNIDDCDVLIQMFCGDQKKVDVIEQ